MGGASGRKLSYELGTMGEPAADPIDRFGAWFEEARAAGLSQPEAMTLATAAPDGRPDCRVVLLKDHDARGFVFYTNLESSKGAQLAANPRAALCFFWERLGRQVRIRGRVEAVSAAEADAYFATRPRGSQVGAWASRQSRVIADRAQLERQVAEVEARYRDAAVPRPPRWSGFRVVPEEIELWQQGESRLHHRELFTREAGGWRSELLSP
jgi:pyridoxamine 5'-phosphate oxidase